MIKKALFLFLITSLNSFSQTLCSEGMAGNYPCKGYDLMAHIPVSTLANTNGNPEGSDIWGWTDPTTGKEYAIAAMTNSTAFVDITDPLNPIFLGRLDSNAGNSYWRDVKLYNNYAFIVADNVGAHGMQVFDLTKLRGVTSPVTFTADKVYTGVGSCHNLFINEASAVAYLVGCGIYNNGPHFVDISDPLNPVSLGGYSGDNYTHDAQVVTYSGPDTDYTGKEIFIGSNANKIVILDVTNKSNIIKIKDINYSQIGYTHQGWFTEDQRYFILGDETDEQNYGMNTRTLIFDFLDLDNPVLSSTYSGPTRAIDHNGYVKGNEYFMANYKAGMRVLDISSIGASSNSMTETGYFDTHPGSNSAAFNGAWSVYPYFASGNIIINDIERGLFIVRKGGTLGVNNLALTSNFSVFPNPAKTETTISTSDNQTIKSVQLYTVLGQKVFDQNNIDQTKYVLTTSNFKKGIYILKINSTITKKMIIK
ncbi:MAG: choice-of-anchor B family protein [Polaribacter sp.]